MESSSSTSVHSRWYKKHFRSKTRLLLLSVAGVLILTLGIITAIGQPEEDEFELIDSGPSDIEDQSGIDSPTTESAHDRPATLEQLRAEVDALREELDAQAAELDELKAQLGVGDQSPAETSEEESEDPAGEPTTERSDETSDDPTEFFYENCDEARAEGAAPVQEGDPGYGPHLDRDGDGIGCE
jgi:hypothetical protein